MIIKPRTKGFICTTAHPAGCAQVVKEQIQYIKSKPPIKNGCKKALIVGASTGYGLASRVTAAFGCQAGTLGVFFERPAEMPKRTATAGWYNSIALEQEAHAAKLYAKSVNGDAFSDEVKDKTLELIKKDLGQIDLLIYSLASPRRTHPKTGLLAKSVLKPINATYSNKSMDLETGKVVPVTVEPANEEEINQTVSVMGGEDWQMWVDRLVQEKLLAANFLTVAYSYMGPEMTMPIYRNGTIGRAKDHLEATAHRLSSQLKSKGGRAFVSINKALVTQSSSAIPFIPLYYVLLSKVLTEKRINEGCIGQIYRVFAEKLYTTAGAVPVDSQGRIRVDDSELRADVQAEVNLLWQKVNSENLKEISDFQGFQEDFLKLFGFGINGVDYNADVNPDLHFNHS